MNKFFKAMELESNNWVYGFYLESENSSFIMQKTTFTLKEVKKDTVKMLATEVVTFDKKRILIFEGDKVLGIKRNPVEIVYHKGAFGYMNKRRSSYYDFNYYDEFMPLCNCDLSEIEILEEGEK